MLRATTYERATARCSSYIAVEYDHGFQVQEVPVKSGSPRRFSIGDRRRLLLNYPLVTGRAIFPLS
jgi:hypothetical protein